MAIAERSTVIAQCTPQGSGAIALLRLSGPQALEIGDKISKIKNKKLSKQATHTIHYGNAVRASGDKIDQVLFLLMKAPQTFTGEDTIEITCHNNQFIISKIIESAITAGAQLAQRGQFTRQAVANSKIDLLQAEAINELIHANSEHILRQSLSQLEGSFSHYLEVIVKNLITAIAYTDASFEFIDEEHLEFSEKIKNIVLSTLKQIDNLKHSFDAQKQVRQGVRVALIGSVNAGKSSLFNSLLGDNRAIVTNRAGTTRDVIEAGFYQNGHYITLVDTAGLRNTDDVIEQEGIKRSYEQAEKADIILLVLDSARQLSKQEKELYQDLHNKYKTKSIIVHNKSDLPKQNNLFNAIALENNIHDKNGHDLIQAQINTKIAKIFATIPSPFLINQRHYGQLLKLEAQLNAIIPLFEGSIAYEIIAYHLNQAVADCAEITGKSASEKAMDAVFREFCVGK